MHAKRTDILGVMLVDAGTMKSIATPLCEHRDLAALGRGAVWKDAIRGSALAI